MKKYIVSLKKSSDEEIISDFIFGEDLGFNGARLDREVFNTKEEAQAEILSRGLQYQDKICVCEITISVEKKS